MTTMLENSKKIDNFEEYVASIIEKSRIESGLSTIELCKLVGIKPRVYRKMVSGDFDCVSHDEFFLILGMIDPKGYLIEELIRYVRIIINKDVE